MKKIVIVILCLLFLEVNELLAQSYINYAEGKPVTLSWNDKTPQKVTDGSLVTGSTWNNPKGEGQTIDIDLTAEFKVGAVHLYLRDRGILPLRNFSVQYKKGDDWVDVPGSSVKDNFSSRVEIKFPEMVSTSAIRVVALNDNAFGIEEIQVWGKDVPAMPYGVAMEEEEPFVAKKHWVCVNQVAYNIGEPKGFTVPTAKTDLPFVIKEKGSGKVVYKGKLKDKKGYFTDFNPKKPEGKEYVIYVEGDGLEAAESYPFKIGKHALQEAAYIPAVEFFDDARSMVGSHPSAYGGTAWRDGTYYTYEVPAMVLFYLSNPKVFDEMPVTLNWEKEKELVLSPEFKPTKEPNDKNALATVKAYYTELPKPKAENMPDIIQCIRFGIGWNLIGPISADPSGDALGAQLHGQTIEQFAYFLYGYPAYKKYFNDEFYKMVLDSTLVWWEKSGLFEVITTIGDAKGRHCPGHSIMPNLLMYEVAKREGLKNAGKFMEAAQNQTKWIIENADWNNPSFSKGQRISEHKLITGLAHFMLNYPDKAPKGLKEKIDEWAKVVVSLSDNMWDFRRFDLGQNWTLPGYNEAGNVIAFPACALSVALVLEDGKLKDRLVELAFSHFDNFNGRNPQNAHCANHPHLGFEGIDVGWPHGDPRRDVCARLELVRGSLSSLPGSEMYPFNPNGRPRHGEGWTTYNAAWDLSIAYLNFYEGVSSATILKNLK